MLRRACKALAVHSLPVLLLRVHLLLHLFVLSNNLMTTQTVLHAPQPQQHPIASLRRRVTMTSKASAETTMPSQPIDASKSSKKTAESMASNTMAETMTSRAGKGKLTSKSAVTEPVTSEVMTSTIIASRRPPPDSRCRVDNGLVDNERSCAGFLVCLKGKAWAVDCQRDLLFNPDLLTCDLPHRVKCGQRPVRTDGDTCYTATVSVTLTVQNDVRQPTFDADVTVRASRQPLRYFLLMAAGLDPRFRYETRHFHGYGDYIYSMNGQSNDLRWKLAAWQMFSKHSGLIVRSVDDFYPEDNDVISLIFTDALGKQTA